MIKFKLEKPDLSKVDAYQVIMKAGQTDDLTKFTAKAYYPQYRYWDKVKYIDRPEGWTAEEFWKFIKVMRRMTKDRHPSVVRSEEGPFFTWEKQVFMDDICKILEKHLAGYHEAPYTERLSGKGTFLAGIIMDEAIASSQLEGANTTRKVAKGMLQKKLKPKNRSMQMIANNYRAMLSIESNYKNSKLDMSMFFKLHELLTKNTMNKKDIGRLRIDADEIAIIDEETGEANHVPPKEAFLGKELARLIEYANDTLNDEFSVHPIIKAIIIHFWVAYLHPFTDGNGRIARALFYWYLFRHNYGLFSYLPLSTIIRKSPAQYRRAYAYTEQDDNDLTYFIDYNIRKITESNTAFWEDLKRKQVESSELGAIAKSKYDLNERQIQLLRYLHKNRNESTTYNAHSNIYNVTLLTARKDLLQLEKLGLLSSKKIGRQKNFFGTDKIAELFEK